MAQIRIPCLVERTNQAGVTSWYWQPSATLKAAGWQPLALGKIRAAAIAAAEARNREVADWKAGGTKPGAVQDRALPGTLSALIARYRRERLEGTDAGGNRQVKRSTAKAYRTSLARLDAWAGKQPLAFITKARVRALRDAVARPREAGGLGHASAHHLLKTLRVVMAFAETLDLIAPGSNPAARFDLAPPRARSRIWTAEDEAAFDAAAYDLGLPTMVLARELALYSAQRVGDLIRFNEHQLAVLPVFDPILKQRLGDAQGTVRGWSFAQAKGSNHAIEHRMEIPLEPGILAKVEAALRVNRARDRAALPRRHTTHVLVSDRDGLPFGDRQFTRAWRAVLARAAEMTRREELRELVWHDLRRTRVVRLRYQRMPKEQIASMTGHSLASIEMMLEVYGPIDPTMTAVAYASTLEREAEPARPGEEKQA